MHRPFLRAIFGVYLVAYVLAHPHHDALTEEEANKPVDNILWIHIFLQATVWGVMFPIGMVLGITRSRWHVPLQATGYALTVAGYILGHSHKGRAFLPSAHGKFSNFLFVPIISQLVLGIYLKLHIHEKSIRPYFVIVHGIIGKTYPILAWTQMLFGIIAFRGYCRGGALGQCLAHYIMGSGFIAYAIMMTLILLVGEQWMRRSGRSPELFDSSVITIWVLNTFTEHHGGAWSVKDMQHTILGVLWWTGGILGIYLSRNNQRNVLPGVIIFLTVHAVFGHTLMLAGFTRILEVCFFSPSYASEAPADDNTSEHTVAEGIHSRSALTGKAAAARSFSYLTPFLLVAAGSAFLLYTFIVVLINLYSTTGLNFSKTTVNVGNGSSIEMVTPGGQSKWYSRLPLGGAQTHVIGDDDEEEDLMAPQHTFGRR
ncbi:hypothetical protein M413DRAFT_442429 [Hebeloma cylindrosporum]|uniref:Cytochrome b561 domain-containing protein n=1 Tax=Hebeloma cylindrosporum TaxID=76867 RepID=A0A0C2Y3L7_HEBCY|nr:hypothetical protein M413DRAFT_442429 [Hebeloma cylindrosporum h7]